jgi:hypothetical protein
VLERGAAVCRMMNDDDDDEGQGVTVDRRGRKR